MTAVLIESWSLTETVKGVLAGTSDPRELLDRSLARIAAVEGDVRAWTLIDKAAALAAADRPTAGPLAGVPLAVKDIIDVLGMPTRCGSALRAGAGPAIADATVVGRLRDAGANPLGKTVTTEFAYFAPGPTRNPAGPEHTPGGSSSGSAAAVAAGMVPLALGSQTAGSLTRPASYCGAAGLVLTTGTVSMLGIAGLAPSLDSVGMLTASVADLRMAWAILTGNGPALGRALQAGPASVTSARILLWQPTDLGSDIEPAMQEAVERAAARLSATGASVTVLNRDRSIYSLVDDHATVMAYEAARERAEELARADELSVPLADLLRHGSQTSAAAYAAAHRRIIEAGRDLDALLTEHDALLGPAATGAAPKGLAATGTPVLSRPWQALGLPVVTVPGLRDEGGMPLGLQLIGRRHGEERLLALGEHLQSLLDGKPIG